MIQPIETKYKGYRFRSRLEARWAVFFDAVGLQWVYEPEGFVLDGIGGYLPDFYLPEWESYIEIKPDIPSSDAIMKLQILARNVNMNRQDGLKEHYMICGVPGNPKFEFRLANPINSVGDGYAVLACTGQDIEDRPFISVNCFAMIRGGKTLDVWPMYFECNDSLLVVPFTIQPQNTHNAKNAIYSPTLHHGMIERKYFGNGVKYDTMNLKTAYTAARSARFEHGENGMARR